jgi:RHS repeat-associated protein
VDALANRTTIYTYDVSDPEFYGSKNNRLVTFTVNQTGGPLLETVWYAYDAEGKVTRKIRNPAGTNSYTATLLVYNSSKQVEYVIGEQWTESGGTIDCLTGYTRTYAWRFRYDGARQRYMRQQLNLIDLTPLSTSWSDYDGNHIYDDFTVAGETATVTRAYESGMAELPAGGTAVYWQGDLIGSNRTLTGAPASAPPIVRRRLYTAFGEAVSTTGTSDSRYRYVGDSGYQSHDDIPFAHIGFRYYDPEVGRFLERDPIAIDGGLNVYEYTRSSPVSLIDASGLITIGVGAEGSMYIPLYVVSFEASVHVGWGPGGFSCGALATFGFGPGFGFGGGGNLLGTVTPAGSVGQLTGPGGQAGVSPPGGGAIWGTAPPGYIGVQAGPGIGKGGGVGLQGTSTGGYVTTGKKIKAAAIGAAVDVVLRVQRWLH